MSKPIKARHQMVMSEVMTPEKANFSGKVHGGHILNFLDKVAYACAARYAGCYVVTLSVDQVCFREPVYVGELLRCLASVNRTGCTSMEIGIRVEAENLMTGECRHTNSCYFTMVAVDEQGKPSPVPVWKPKSAVEQRRQQHAQLRVDLRQQFQQAHADMKKQV